MNAIRYNLANSVGPSTTFAHKDSGNCISVFDTFAHNHTMTTAAQDLKPKAILLNSCLIKDM